jgi:chromosome partitioning protein
MKTLVVMNEKGGVGKTNIVAHAGWFFAERHRTLVIDLDQQGNLTYTLGKHVAQEASVSLFEEGGRIAPVGALTVARSSRDLLTVEQADTAVLSIFRDNLHGMADDYDLCVIDTPPALANRTFGALLAADAVLAPIQIADYSLAGISALLDAIKGVSAYYERVPPKLLGLIPSIFDRRSNRERALFEALAGEVGQLLFPGIVAKRDAYARANGEALPVWEIKTDAGRLASEEIRGVFKHVEDMMGLA